MSREDAFVGKWKLVKSTENFGEFLEKMGAPWLARKMAVKSSPTQEITRDGGKFTIKTHMGLGTREDSFTVGEEYVREHDNMKMKTLVVWDGDKLLTTAVPVEAGKGQKHTRSRYINEEGELVMEITLGDMVVVRTFKKI